MFLGIVNCYLFEQMGNFTFFPTQRISHRKSIPQNICTHLRDIRFLLIMYVTFVKQKWQFQEEGWTLSTGIRTILNCWLRGFSRPYLGMFIILWAEISQKLPMFSKEFTNFFKKNYQFFKKFTNFSKKFTKFFKNLPTFTNVFKVAYPA